MDDPKLLIEWFKYDCKQEDRDERRQLVLSAKPTLEILRKIIQERLNGKHDERRSRKNYDSPNWALIQADLLGAERELEELLDLLTIEA